MTFRQFITLRCPACQRTMTTFKAPDMPEDARVLECPCPKCAESEWKERYFDRNGNELLTEVAT